MRSPRLTLAALAALAVTAVSAGVVLSVGCSGNDGADVSSTPDGAPPGDSGAGGGDGSAADGAADAAVDSGAASEPSAGCATPRTTYRAGTTEGAVSAGGRSRTFRVHVPPGYVAGAPAPVVIVLHGGGGSAEQIQNDSAKMDPIADRDGFVTVYPNGTGLLKTWNAGLCCGKAVEDGVDDVGFVALMLDHLEAELCVDRRRVFATGMSNGGLMSHRLACELSTRIAAIAPVAGTIGVASCTPARPVPTMQIHGTLDGHVPWDGGVGCGPSGADFTGVPSTMEGWCVRNGCTAATATYFTQGDGQCTAYQGCKAPVVLCAVQGGGHSWPGGVVKGGGVIDCPADGPQSTTFIASEAAWQFFKANPRPAP